MNKITRGEIVALVARLPQGELYDWCASVGAAGAPTDVVYADTLMLSRCRQAAVSLPVSNDEGGESNQKPKSKRKKKESNHDADIHRPAGPDLEHHSDGPKDAS